MIEEDFEMSLNYFLEVNIRLYEFLYSWILLIKYKTKIWSISSLYSIILFVFNFKYLNYNIFG